MTQAERPFRLRIHFGWALALWLCLPLGQWASSVHLLSHLASKPEQSQSAGDLLHLCETCFSAVTLVGGSPVDADVPQFRPALTGHAHAVAPSQPLGSVGIPSDYLSRAPPIV